MACGHCGMLLDFLCNCIRFIFMGNNWSWDDLPPKNRQLKRTPRAPIISKESPEKSRSLEWFHGTNSPKSSGHFVSFCAVQMCWCTCSSLVKWKNLSWFFKQVAFYWIPVFIISFYKKTRTYIYTVCIFEFVVFLWFIPPKWFIYIPVLEHPWKLPPCLWVQNVNFARV